jgi:hypothetical protein
MHSITLQMTMVETVSSLDLVWDANLPPYKEAVDRFTGP